MSKTLTEDQWRVWRSLKRLPSQEYNDAWGKVATTLNIPISQTYFRVPTLDRLATTAETIHKFAQLFTKEESKYSHFTENERWVYKDVILFTILGTTSIRSTDDTQKNLRREVAAITGISPALRQTTRTPVVTLKVKTPTTTSTTPPEVKKEESTVSETPKPTLEASPEIPNEATHVTTTSKVGSLDEEINRSRRNLAYLRWIGIPQDKVNRILAKDLEDRLGL
jgi:hypothetical protein